jgi:hypothetical protein
LLLFIILLIGCACSTLPQTDHILASGPITTLSEPVDLTYRPCRLDFFHITRMEVNGHQTSHRQASLTNGRFITDPRGQKSQWQIRLRAYEDTDASRLFPRTLAGLKEDARALADDLVPCRLAGPVRTGDRLLRIKVHALPQLLQRMGINGRPRDLMPGLEELVLAVEGWRPYQGRHILAAAGSTR